MDVNTNQDAMERYDPVPISPGFALSPRDKQLNDIRMGLVSRLIYFAGSGPSGFLR